MRSCPSLALWFSHAVLGLIWLAQPPPASASLAAYDAAVTADAAAGLAPVARLLTPVTLTGSNRGGFDFGATSGDATLEFVLQGDPNAGSGSAYLAVGANTGSNLRYEQFSNTGQLGFTQLGVADYLFSPAVPSPVGPTHIAYVWNATTRTMKLYLNGTLAGSSSGVAATFALPSGPGWIGGNPGGGETMVGTVHRVTVYDDPLPDAMLQRHADAFNDVLRPPLLVDFAASPNVLFSPAPATLSWSVLNAIGVFLDGAEVGGTASRQVTPSATTLYTLVATNLGGSVTGRVTVVVNPAPTIQSFTPARGFVAPGGTASLSWTTLYGDTFSISPSPGDVTPLTLNGAGTVPVNPSATTLYTLSARNPFGTTTASVQVLVVQPAGHVIISEFMADNHSTLADEDGAFSDWIEIGNPTPSAVNLAGYYLTDDPATPTKWAFPGVVLEAGQFRVIFASGKNRTNPTAPLHTNFQLDKGGEYLALVGPGPTVLQVFANYPPQQQDVAYGLLGGDDSLRRFLGHPTPGAANDDAPPRPGDVQFSRASGLFTDPFALALSCDTFGAEIYYTTNGAAPGAGIGTRYTAPLPVSGTTRVRAVAVAYGQAGRAGGASFVRLSAELLSYTSSLPILVIENFGAGVIPQKGWTGNGAGVRQVPRQEAVWATFERQNGSSALTNAPQMFSPIGIRGRGAFSSSWRQKPYSVEASDEAGETRSVSPLGLPAHSEWVLYYPDPDDNKDPTLLFNAFPYELSRQTGHYAVRFRWVEAFVNEDGGDLRLADRRGVYAILEKVSRGADRLDFQPLEPDGTAGSWLLNINRMDPEPETGWPAENGAIQPWFFHTAGPNRIAETPANAQVLGDDEPQQSNGYLNFDNPSGYSITLAQRAAIEAWFKQFEDVLWNNALWRDPDNGYRRYLDPVDFADYFILNNLTRNGDGLLISMFPWKGDDGKLRMGPAWDYNWSAYFISGAPANTPLHRPDRLWYKRLFADIDFGQLYIDRWWDQRRGAMSNAGMDAILDAQIAEIGDKAVLNGFTNTAAWLGRVTQMKTWLKDRANWLDGFYVRPPTFNQDGGEIPDGFQLTIYSTTNGTTFYTTDGTDPRLAGGGLAPGAQTFQLPFPIVSQTLVSARIRVGPTNWSGLTRALFQPPQDLSGLAVTEIMYNPPPWGALAGDEVEFLELKNTGATPLRLGGFFLEGVGFTFTNGTRLDPGQFFLLVRNAAAFQEKYPGRVPHGVYTGRLDNGGETVRVRTSTGQPVLAVTYNDRAPWPLAPDGHGFSLVPRDARALNSEDGARWRASRDPGGSPGADDPEPSIRPILVNEVQTHTELPELDWIELYNPNPSPADLGGWFLSDDAAAPTKYRIPPGTSIAGGGYRVFTENDFNAAPGLVNSFSLDSSGDSVYLSSGDAATNLTGYSHGFAFGAAARGVSFGRWVNSVGEEQFPAQVASTRDSTNAGPRFGPIVIQEIQYHPALGEDEFLELRNLTDGTIPLFDPAHPTNTWRINGLGYVFPTNISMAAQGLLLVVATDPASFRLKYGVAAAVPVLGPFAGGLQDSGERLELQRPDVPGTNGVPYITVDGVRYNDRAPWPSGADGSGPSLQRQPPSAYGDDPLPWQAARATPGGEFVPGPQAPAILTQPQPQTVLASGAAEFTVTASGTPPLFYQWLFGGDAMLQATNPSVLLVNIQPGQAGDYRVVVFNQAGSAVSAPARLTVNRQPTLLSQPTNLFVRPGAAAAFSVNAVGNGLLRYQWRRNGLSLPGATNSTLSLTNVQAAQAGTYTVLVTDSVGPILSAPAELTLLINPLIIQPPLSQPVRAGGAVTLSVIVTNTANLPIGYLWRTNGRFWITNVLAHHTNFITITNVQKPWTNYTVVATNAAFPSGILSAAALLSVLTDTDGDGLPDEWETAYGLGTNNAADAALDLDGDGMSNRDEFIAGTDPNNAASYLRIDLARDGATATLSVGAVSNKTYSIEYQDGTAGAAWRKLADLPARAGSRTETVVDGAFSTNRLYRVVTPRR